MNFRTEIEGISKQPLFGCWRRTFHFIGFLALAVLVSSIVFQA